MQQKEQCICTLLFLILTLSFLRDTLVISTSLSFDDTDIKLYVQTLYSHKNFFLFSLYNLKVYIFLITMNKEIYDRVMADISKIVKKAVNENNSSNDYITIIERLDEQIFCLSVGFSFPKLTTEEINEVWNVNPIPYESDFSFLNLNESEDVPSGCIYPPETVISVIKSKYRLKDWQLHVNDNQTNTHRVKCIVAIPNNSRIKSMENWLLKDIDKLGYFLSSYKDVTDSGKVYRLFVFEPKCYKNEATNIRKSKVLYHITPAFNLDSILKYGFIPHSRRNIEKNYVSYPERTFFLPATTDGYYYDAELETKKLAENIYRHKLRKSSSTTPEYAIISIDMKTIPEDIEMYYDPDSDFGIFVEKNIPAECIFDIEIYDCKKKMPIDKMSKFNKLKSKLLSIFKK